MVKEGRPISQRFFFFFFLFLAEEGRRGFFLFSSTEHVPFPFLPSSSEE